MKSDFVRYKGYDELFDRKMYRGPASLKLTFWTTQWGPITGAGGYFAARPANYSDLRAVRHAELAHDLPNMKFDGTFTHRQPARNDLVRIATAQKCEDRSLPRC